MIIIIFFRVKLDIFISKISGKKPKAIISPIEGTTRDILETTMDINGYPLILMDTAGLRSKTSDVIEMEGMRRALDSVDNADLILFVADVTRIETKDYERYFEQYLKELRLENLDLRNKKFIIVFNKCDLIDLSKDFMKMNMENFVFLSCTTNYGIDRLFKELVNHLKEM